MWYLTGRACGSWRQNCQASIEQTIDAAKETTAEIETSAAEEDNQEEDFWSGLVSAVTDGVSGVISDVTDKAGEMINNLLEALAVMLVTCCVIPILVLLSFIWFAKIVLAIDIPVDYSGIKGALSRKSHKNPQDI